MSTSAPGEGRHAAGVEDLVALDPDHPGFRDPVYRAHRNEIARIALEYVVGDPVPRIAYNDAEHAVWRTVWENLSPLHARSACREYLESSARLGIDHARIPQLADVNAQLQPLTGFQMIPVAGLVSSRAFLSQLGKATFLSTQYIRHASRPLYTPEPDIIHELVGHACTLCHSAFADLNRLFGAAAARVDESAIPAIERVYWYTLEFGLVEQEGAFKAYGAGLLSSYGELGNIGSATIRRFDPDEAASRPYDPTTYQTALYYVPDFEALTAELTRWLDRQ